MSIVDPKNMREAAKPATDPTLQWIIDNMTKEHRKFSDACTEFQRRAEGIEPGGAAMDALVASMASLSAEAANQCSAMSRAAVRIQVDLERLAATKARIENVRSAMERLAK